VSAARGERPFHRGLVRVAGGQSGLVVHAGDAEQEDLRGHRARRLDRRRAARDRGMLEQPPAQDEHLDRGVLDQGGGDRRAVRDHGGGQVGGQRLGDREGGGAAVEQDRAARVDQGGGRGRDALFAVGGDRLPGRVVGDRGGDRQRAAVDPLAQPGGGEFAQVAADAVLGDAEFGGDLFGQHFAVGAQHAQQQVAPLADQHPRSSILVRVLAEYCTFCLQLAP
jgi:hypothetical protein